MLAMRAYRDHGASAAIKEPKIVLPITAHAAFDKAAKYFGIESSASARSADLRADVEAARDASTTKPSVVVGSAPSFPHGSIDPIEELAELAARARHRLPHRRVPRRLPAAVDGAAGYDVPPFDFRVPGVTSMSR